MGLTRKELLASGAAVALVGCGGKKKTPAAAATPAASGWAGVRSQFALDPKDRHFDAFLFAPHPKPVRAAIATHRDGLDAGAAAYLHEHEETLDAAVAAAGAEYLGVNAGELAFVDSTTMGLGLIYSGVKLGRGDEVLTTEHDHYATHETLRLRAVRDGATIKRVRLYDDPAQATADEMIDRLQAAITPKTKVLALTWVHSGTGVKLPLARLTQALGNSRPLVVVDGVHALGVEADPIDIHLLDVLVAGTHKWLGGPRGTGIIWSIKGWDRLTPVIPTFDLDSYLAWMEGGALDVIEADAPGAALHARRLPQLRASLGARAGVRVADRAGPGEGGRAHPLARPAAQGRAGRDAPRAADHAAPRPRSRRASCASTSTVWQPEDAVQRLAERDRIRASVTPYAERHVRLGTSLHVDERDVDAALGSVEALRG